MMKCGGRHVIALVVRRPSSGAKEAMRRAETRSMGTATAAAGAGAGVAKERLVFFGTPAFVAPCLRALLQDETVGASVTAVVVGGAAKGGRDGAALRNVAQEFGIEVLHTANPASDEAFLDDLERRVRPTVCLSAAFGGYFPLRLLDMPRHGAWNIHPSLLPKYRGAAPVPKMLEQGDAETGVSLARMVKKMDAGPLLAQATVPLVGHETTGPLLESLFSLGGRLFQEHLPSILNNTAALHMWEQDETAATWAHKVDAADALVDPATLTATQIVNKARAYDGVFARASMYIGKRAGVRSRAREPQRILLHRVSEGVGEDRDPALGEDLAFDKPSKALRVRCCDGSTLCIHELQPEGRKIMSAAAFFNGSKGDGLFWASPPPS